MRIGCSPVGVDDEIRIGCSPVGVDDEIRIGCSPVGVDDEIRIGCSPVGVDDSREVDCSLDIEVLVENSSLDELNSVVELKFPPSDVELIVDKMVVDSVDKDIDDASVGTGGLIDISDVIGGTWEEEVDDVDITASVDEPVEEVSVGSGGIDSSGDIVGRVEVFVVETSDDWEVGLSQSRREISFKNIC